MEQKTDKPEATTKTGEKTGREATQFKPGHAPMGGRPKGSRDKLQRDFLAAVSEDFAEHGKAAIVKCREETPAVYIKVIASLMPKEIDLESGRPLAYLSDEELIAIMDRIQENIKREEARLAERQSAEDVPVVMSSTGTVQ